MRKRGEEKKTEERKGKREEEKEYQKMREEGNVNKDGREKEA